MTTKSDVDLGHGKKCSNWCDYTICLPSTPFSNLRKKDGGIRSITTLQCDIHSKVCHKKTDEAWLHLRHKQTVRCMGPIRAPIRGKKWPCVIECHLALAGKPGCQRTSDPKIMGGVWRVNHGEDLTDVYKWNWLEESRDTRGENRTTPVTISKRHGNRRARIAMLDKGTVTSPKT